MTVEEISREDMAYLFKELYWLKFGGSLEELKASNPEKRGLGELNPGLDRCTIMGTNEDKDIEIRFQDSPECWDAKEEYREILKAALGGAETVYRTLRE